MLCAQRHRNPCHPADLQGPLQVVLVPGENAPQREHEMLQESQQEIVTEKSMETTLLILQRSSLVLYCPIH